MAIFQPGRTKTGKAYFYALALEDAIILKGEKLSLFYHGGLNDELKQKLIQLKKEEPATRALRKKLDRARYLKLFDAAKALPEETEKEEPQPVKLVYLPYTGDDEDTDEPADELDGGDDQEG